MQSFVKGEVLQPNDAPVEFSVPGAKQPKVSEEGRTAKPSLLDLLPKSPKRMPQVDGPGDDSDEEPAEKKKYVEGTKLPSSRLVSL